MSKPTYDAKTIWQTTYGDLELQLPRDTFDTWLRTARFVGHEDGSFIIGVSNNYARDWLEQRLKKVVLRTLEQVARQSVEVRFVIVKEKAAKKKPLHSAGPLLESLQPEKTKLPKFQHLAPGETGLNLRFTLDAYAVGQCNRLAHAAAQAVVDAPAQQFNPLFIHSAVGLGKSHLLHAIGNACQEKGLRALYVPAETFTNDLIAAIKSHQTEKVREKYRAVDVLLVDDIQFIAGKESTQEEFYHTFNTLFTNDAQIIVTSNLAPGKIKRLDPRLKSRFEGGLVVELHRPDYETRVDILDQKAKSRNFADRLPLELLEVVAEETEGCSVRELEGAMNRIIAASLLTQGTPSLHSLASILNLPRISAEQSLLPDTDMDDIIMAVADFYDIDPKQLRGRGRSRKVSTARQVAMFIAHKEIDLSLQAVGDALGGRNHSTVLYSCDRVLDLLEVGSPVNQHIQQIKQSLKG